MGNFGKCQWLGIGIPTRQSSPAPSLVEELALAQIGEFFTGRCVFIFNICKFSIEMGTQTPTPEDLAKKINWLAEYIKGHVNNPDGMVEKCSESFIALATLNPENVTREHCR